MNSNKTVFFVTIAADFFFKFIKVLKMRSRKKKYLYRDIFMVIGLTFIQKWILNQICTYITVSVANILLTNHLIDEA